MTYRFLFFALVSVLVAGCDDLTGPARINEYDPETTGRRVVSEPTNLRIASATPSTTTLAWTPNSSFAAGYRIEVLEQNDFQFRIIATLPASDTTFTHHVDTRSYTYRVVALAPEQTEGRGYQADSVPSDVLRTEYRGSRTTRVQINEISSVFSNASTQFSGDGSALYLTLGTGASAVVRAYATDSGAELWTEARAREIITLGSRGRLLLRANADSSRFLTLAADGQTLRDITLDQFANLCPSAKQGVSRPSLSVDYDLEALICSSNSTADLPYARQGKLVTWNLESGEVASNVPYQDPGYPSSQWDLLPRSPSAEYVIGYLAADTGPISALRTDRREEIWTASLRPDYPFVLSFDATRIFASLYENPVREIDMRTGRTLRTIPEPFQLQSLSSDGSRGIIQHPFPSYTTSLINMADLRVLKAYYGVFGILTRPTADGIVVLTQAGEIVRLDAQGMQVEV